MNKNAINALIADEAKGLMDDYIETSALPEGSFPRLYRKNWVHFLERDRDGKLSLPAINTEVTEDTASPNDLYDALEDTHSPRVFCNKESRAKKWSIIILYVIIFGLFFMLFMIWAVNL